MIEHLQAGKTANFFALSEPLTDGDIEALFDQLRAGQPTAQANLFRHRREVSGASIWSAISFLYEQSPSFLPEQAHVRELACGFLMVVEHRGHVAVFKSRLDLPPQFKRLHLRRVPVSRVDLAVARHDAIFEKIRLRNMSVSKLAMRTKTLEADDLRNTVGPAASSRYVPQAYTVRTGVGHYSATPSTGRIAQRSDRVGHEHLIEYAAAVIDSLLAGAGAPAPFIDTFARAIDLAAIGNVALSSFAVDVAGLAEDIHEHEQVRLVRMVDGAATPLTAVETAAVLAELNVVFEVHGLDRAREIRDDAGARRGAVAVNKDRIALRDLQLPLAASVEVERTAHPIGQDPDRISLRKHIDRENRFIVLFEDVSLAYIDGTLYRDGGLTQGGTELLRYLRPDAALAGVTSEKGRFAANRAAFQATSTFGVVVDRVSLGDDVLVCDDLGDEWADFIGLNNTSTPPRITFYHAKHGALSLGASPFHVSVGQAMKNLGRMALPVDAMPAKIATWQQTYSNENVRSAIPRTLRGNANRLLADFEAARLAPDAIRRVVIVTSSLSFGAVQGALAEIAAGGRRPDPYFVQLYWLLMSFFSACAEVNAHGYMVCRE
ncbi:conserved hypothetical protein [Bosea sp. 62]|uniref:hypothetical protein n=1 Tax=unclassified Bosea (in: a-proteobacteria) TaxID=2653178 RepID=UPI00125A5A80|nr:MULTISPECIES: hypothetical protein [unclassified Bosea (in: a-proteobacteria)]CAD5261057.1 conserved hypothetical protein [Bosea sp. 7B]CAD5271521.1 conserved hypothetical protein [Bosea sp. 21B]CAD5273676.1 conserved hypothetical protein [Bosea sp. 46]VVT56181.1 conserved hypothetical protein [Bosea sp. EC-HK365B]VXB63634.1 conserved hypothetical protein [Bosea sp. 62]